MLGKDTLTPASHARIASIVAMAEPEAGGGRRSNSPALIGEYGWDHDVLYIREKDGKLNALIEWFFEYPLERVSRDVYRFPDWGLYDGSRSSSGAVPMAKRPSPSRRSVPFKRTTASGRRRRVNFRITPVRPVAELRTRSAGGQPARGTGDFRPTDLVELRSLDSTIKLRHPLRDVEQLHGHAVLLLGARLHAAAGRGGGRARARPSSGSWATGC